jgi:hypothetical protein
MKNSEEKKSFPEIIDVHYLKTSSYRSYYVDGIFGGPTAHGKLYIELFLERSVTPQIIQHKVTAEGTLGEEIDRIGKKGIIREIEAGLIMDISIAKIFRDWLNGKIELYEKLLKEQKGMVG